jgi:hypothetical protein
MYIIPCWLRQKKGKYTRLVGRHANYNIGPNAADRWVEHMETALEQHSILSKDDEAKECLRKYFRYTAHYIVTASEFMRGDQVKFSLSFVREDFVHDDVHSFLKMSKHFFVSFAIVEWRNQN